MKKYDVSYYEGNDHKVIRLYASRSEAEIIEWLESHLGASNIILKAADTSDEKAGLTIIRI